LPPAGLKGEPLPAVIGRAQMTWQQITAAYMPALVILVTVYIASVSNNKRIDDLRVDLNKRMDDLRGDVNKRMDDLRGDVNKRMDDLRTEMRDGFRKLEERFEHPITRP
jgi:hypothetical protein